jgi:hypothetical protein
MTRRRPQRPALPLLFLLATAALPGCGGGPGRPAASSPGQAQRIAIPPPSAAGAPFMQTAAAPSGLRPGQVYVVPPPSPAQRDQAVVAAACREQAERTILERDRGQLLREDEAAARMGASASLNDTRFRNDQLGRVFARDRLAEDCVDANRPPLNPRTAAPPAPTTR